MSNSHKLVKKERLVSDFLTEQDVREVIRRRILIYESTKNPIYKLILEQGTGNENIDAKFEALGLDGMGAAETARKAALAIGALSGVGTTAAIMAIPLVPITMKLKAIALIRAGAAVAVTIMDQFVQELILENKIKELFMHNGRGLSSPAVKMANALATGVTSGKLKMPELPPNLGGVPNTLGLPSPTGIINPDEYEGYLNDYADTISGPCDFLGIPNADFATGQYKSSGLPYWSALCAEADYADVATNIWKEFTDNLSAVTNDGPESMIIKIKTELAGMSALDLVYIDWEL